MLNSYRWEYSPLARIGDWIWQRAIDPFLRLLAPDKYTILRRGRGLIQIIVVVAILMIPVSFCYSPGHILTASGLLFDIAGVLRLFILEETERALTHFAETRQDNLPSHAMRELIMPEASSPYNTQSDPVSLFFYTKRGVLFLFIGFVLQMFGDLAGRSLRFSKAPKLPTRVLMISPRLLAGSIMIPPLRLQNDPCSLAHRSASEP